MRFFYGLNYNLACAKGHRHYSPQPAQWIGRDCKWVDRRGSKGGPVSLEDKGCKLPLRVIPA